MLAGVVWTSWMVSGIVASASTGAKGYEALSPSSSYYLEGAISIVAVAGVLGGLVALHVRQEESYGWLGTSGFFAAFIGTALVFMLVAVLVVSPANGRGFFDRLAGLGPLWGVLFGRVLLGVGFTLLGVATVRARVLPRWCGVVLIAALPVSGAVASALGFYGGGTVLGVAWLTLGRVLWSERGEPA